MMANRATGVAGLAVIVLVTASCATTTPRHGARVAAVRGGSAQPASGAQSTNEASAATGPAPATEAGGSAAGGATGTAAPSAAVAVGSSASPAGGGSASPQVANPTAGGGGAVSRPAPLVGVTKDTITISAMAGFSGSYGAILNKIYDNGFGTWLDDVNAHGGIRGRKVISKKVDNKDTADGGVAACKQAQTNGSYLAVSIVGFGGADMSASDCLDRAGVTTLAFNLSGFRPAWRHVYSAGDAGKQTGTIASFIQNVIGDRTGKIGIIYTNDALNRAGRGALAQEMHRRRMNLVSEQAVAPDQGSYVGELSRLRDAGATTVALIVNTNEVLGILRDARVIGYAPNWTGNYWVTDENTLAARGLFEGIKAVRNYAGTNSAAYADYAVRARKYGHGDVSNSTTMALYGMGLVVGQILQNTGPTPTSSALDPAIESLVDYNNQITMALSFGRGVRVAEVGMWPIQCCNSDSTWKGIGEPKREF